MGIFSRFPYTDFHRLNADWILDKIKEMLGLTQQAADDAAAAADDAAAAAASADEAATGSVRYDRVQDLTALQQGQARSNILAAPADMFGTVRYDEVQLLGDPQKLRARSNIGAASAADLSAVEDVAAGAIRYDVTQELTDAQKTAARTNIGSAAAADVPTTAVLYSSQSLTDEQKTQARANIGAAAQGSGPAPVGAVLYDQSQSLTSEQQGTARNNINAAGLVDPSFEGSIQLSIDAGVTYEADEIQITPNSAQNQSILNMFGLQSSHVIIRGVDDPVNDYDAVNLKTLYAVIIKEVTVTGNTPTIDLADEVEGDAYETVITCTGSALTSITISTAVNSTMLATIVFTTGSTAPTFDSPLTIIGLDDLIPEANTIYEISIRSNRAVWHSWEVPTP